MTDQEMVEKVAQTLYSIVATEMVLFKHPELLEPRSWEELPELPNKNYWRVKAEEVCQLLDQPYLDWAKTNSYKSPEEVADILAKYLPALKKLDALRILGYQMSLVKCW